MNEYSIVIPLGMSLLECKHQVAAASLAHAHGDKQATATSLGISLEMLYDSLAAHDVCGSPMFNSAATALPASRISIAASDHQRRSASETHCSYAIDHAHMLSESSCEESALVLNTSADGVSEYDVVCRTGMTLWEYEKQVVLANVEDKKGDRRAAATILGITITALCDRLEEYGYNNTQTQPERKHANVLRFNPKRFRTKTPRSRTSPRLD